MATDVRLVDVWDLADEALVALGRAGVRTAGQLFERAPTPADCATLAYAALGFRRWDVAAGVWAAVLADPRCPAPPAAPQPAVPFACPACAGFLFCLCPYSTPETADAEGRP